MAGDGSGLRRLTSQSGTDFDPSWSPDGREIVFRTSRGHYAADRTGTGTEGILVVDATSGKERQLFPPSPNKVGGLFPDWAPSGKQVALATLDDRQQERIAIVDAATGALLRLLPTTGECIDWSPDGKQLSFCAHGAILNDWDIYVIGADGSALRQLTSTPDRQYGGLWSADGKRLLYQQYSGDRLADIWVMSADGNHQRQLTSGPGIKAPDVWLPDGRIIFESSEPDAPYPSWFIMDADGSHMQAVGQLDALQTGGPIDWRP